MSQFWQYTWRITTMLVLLFGSGFFSGSETAFFHLSRRKVSQFSKSSNRFEKLVAEILLQPSRFLTTLLFGNMVVNIFFFSISGVLTVRLDRQFGHGIAGTAAFLSFLCLLLFGELLPKSLAYSHAASYCRWASIPCYLLLRTVGTALKWLDLFLIQPFCRLMIGSRTGQRPGDAITMNQIRMLLESSRRQGLITSAENRFLAEVLKFGYLKVRHVMCPRVDMLAFDIHTPTGQILQAMVEKQVRFAPVYQDNMDRIVGIVDVRNLLLHPEQPVIQSMEPPLFIPEQKTVESLLNDFQKADQKYAVVVDEYGGLAGAIHRDDLTAELIGLEPADGQMEPVESIGPLTYRLSAQLSIHDWIEAFGIDPDQTRIATVGGLVTALLGKIPKPGDTVYWKNLKFTVEAMQHHRIHSILLSLEAVRNGMPEDVS